MASEFTVRSGRALGPEAQRSVDRHRMAVLHRVPPQGRVEGQYPIHAAYECPYCGMIGYAWLDTEIPTTVHCWCGGIFEA